MKNENITLLVLAAGMGSRYGSLKQVDKIGPSGETITDYSIYDALKAGFNKVVFVIRKNIESDFKEVFGRIEKHVEVEYVFQELNAIPAGIEISPERVKPWGTGHAVLMAMDKINTPFAIINADDFYGAASYQIVANYLKIQQIPDNQRYCMVGFELKRTLSEFGHVSRGICDIDSNGYLNSITERTKIQYTQNNQKIVFIDENENEHTLTGNEIVSMNFWGFPPSIFQHLEKKFDTFIRKQAMNPKAEFYLPFAIDELIKEKIAQVKVLPSPSDWFGVTYKEDKEITIRKIRQLIEQGIYPEKLW